jgi:hypothetical protein
MDDAVANHYKTLRARSLNTTRTFSFELYSKGRGEHVWVQDSANNVYHCPVHGCDYFCLKRPTDANGYTQKKSTLCNTKYL